MRRVITVSLIVIFVLWLVPLGVFIVPSKEKLLCDGQRAMCLCSHSPSMGKKTDEGKILLKAAPSSNKESSSAAGHFYLSAGKHMENNIKTALYFLSQESLYALIIPKSVEHVPKV